MKIDHYIVRGGENLNSPARKTPGFPAKAETLFGKWHSKLGKDDREEENYFEMPVDGQTRLFLRAFWVEKLGHRPVCYYVGLLIEREAYMLAQEYFKLHKGICHISWQDIESAMEHDFAPIEFPIDFPVPRSTIGLDFSELSQMRFYGDEFDKNISEMCLSISVNSIEDWFGRLFIAVNPDRLDPAFHIVVSRKSPRPAFKVAESSEKIPEDDPNETHPQRNFHPQASDTTVQPKSPKFPDNIQRNLFKVVGIIIFCIVIIIFFKIKYSGKIDELHEQIQDLNGRVAELTEQHNTDQGTINNLKRKLTELTREIIDRDKEIKGLKNKVKESSETNDSNNDSQHSFDIEKPKNQHRK